MQMHICMHSCMHLCTPVDKCGSQRSRSRALPNHSSALFSETKSLLSLTPTNQSSHQVPGVVLSLPPGAGITGNWLLKWVLGIQYSHLCTSPLLLHRETLFLTNKKLCQVSRSSSSCM